MRHAGCLTWNVHNSRIRNSIFITHLGLSHQDEPAHDAKTLHDEREEMWQVSHLPKSRESSPAHVPRGHTRSTRALTQSFM